MPAKRLMILRHGKSAWDDPRLADFDRPLAGRGRRAAAAMGLYLADEGLVPDLILCSAARRAVETWAVASRVSNIEAPSLEEAGLYLAGPSALLARCRKVEDSVATLALVGHHPGHDGLASELVRDAGPSKEARRMAQKFPTAALAVIDLPDAPWSALAPGQGTLERFVAPKDLV